MRLIRKQTLVLAVGIFLAVFGVVTVWAQTKPIVSVYPTGNYAWPGSVIWVEFDRSLDHATTEAAFGVEPAAGGVFSWNQDSRTFEYRPDEPFEPAQTYQVTLGTGIRDIAGQPVLDVPYSWSFTVQQSSQRISFNYGVPVQFVTPSGKRGVPVQPGYPRMTLELSLYALDLATFADRYADLQPFSQTKIDVSGLPLVKKWSAHIDATENVGEIGLPSGTTPGLYVLDARQRIVGDAQTMLVLTDYALVAKRGRDDPALWLTTMPDGVPVPGATVSVYDEQGTDLGSAVTNDDGVAHIAGLTGAAFATGEVAGQTTLVGLDNYWCSDYRYCGGYWDGRGMVRTPPEYAGHVHTDRPIYRPGHTVHYKATLRHIERDGYSVVDAALPLTVTIKDSGNNTVARHSVSADAFGSIAGDLQLGDDVALGDWRVEVSTGAQTFSGYFQVEEYVKPDYQVVVDTDRPFYVRGDTAEVSVQADYYFGQPAAGAELTLRVFRGYYYYRSRSGNQVGEFRGVTDPDGHWSANIPLLGNSSNTEQYFFEAEVVDASRRPVVAEGSAPVHPAAFNLSLQNQRYGVETGQPVVLTARTIGHDGQPVPDRHVTIEVRQYRRYGYETVRRATVTTDAGGSATVTLEGLTESWFQITATARDDAGHQVEAYSYAWTYSRYRPWYWWGGLEITADRDSYAAGDMAQLLIKSPVTTTALITLERDNVVDELIVEVSGATTVEVPIKAEYAPNVYARVQLWQPLDDPNNRAEGRLLTAERWG